MSRAIRPLGATDLDHGDEPSDATDRVDVAELAPVPFTPAQIEVVNKIVRLRLAKYKRKLQTTEEK